MQYAFVDGIKTEASKGADGYCTICGEKVIARCGEKNVKHWSHKKTNCDKWWETETEWHREWKNKFPEEYREVVFHDSMNNEIHRADIRNTILGVTIEFQSSPLTIDELKSREQFYQKLIWVINGLKFKERFKLMEKIPNPESHFLFDYEFSSNKFSLEIFRKHPVRNKPDKVYYEPRLIRNIHPKLALSESHFLFQWKNQHNVWFNSECPMFIDFGNDDLYWLKRKRQQYREDFWYIQIVKKEGFIKKYQ